MLEKNQEYVNRCKNVAEELETYADNAYRCPHCECVHAMSDYEETEHDNENYETCYTCPNCGGEIVEHELEAVFDV